MDNANVSVGSIQRILGHENRKTTEIYLHGLSESERQAMEIYEKVRTFSHHQSTHLGEFPRNQVSIGNGQVIENTGVKMVRPAGFEPATYGFEVPMARA